MIRSATWAGVGGNVPWPLPTTAPSKEGPPGRRLPELQDVDIDLPKISQRTRAQESRARNAAEARLQTGKPGTDVVRQEDRARERHRHSRGSQGQLGCYVCVDRLEPKREATQARSQDRLQGDRISCASIDGDDEESWKRKAATAAAPPASTQPNSVTGTPLRICRSEAWRPLSLRWMVCRFGH
jgi:hypothetical protein